MKSRRIPDMTSKVRKFGVVVAGVVILWPALSYADATQLSPNYSVNESQIGGVGDFNSTSTSYSFKPGVSDGGSTLGDSFIGNSSSTNFQTNSGANTASSPTLTFSVTGGLTNLGTLSQLSASTGTATFSVIDYTSYGYAVTVVGAAPTTGSHTLTPLTTDTASVAGTEQFGMNVVSNTSPVSVGSDPVQDVNTPGTVIFGFGVAGDGLTGLYGSSRPYTISGKYRYVSGDTIASSPKSSGKTSYTATFMANIAPLTPSGSYQANLTLIATGTY